MRVASNALKVNESTCRHMKCTFGGVWNGGGGDGLKNLFVASFFFDRASEVAIIPVFCCSRSTNKKVGISFYPFPWLCLTTYLNI